MSHLDSLPPDLRAVLSLLLRQRKRYAEVAALLDIEERAVHDRAHAALALLAPREARELSAPQREQVGEYLLGQQDPATESRTRAYLEESAAGRTWARALSAELGALATRPLPHVPAGPAPSAPGAVRQAQGPTATPGSQAPSPAAESQLSSSRVGGAVILGVLAAVVIVVVLLIVGVGGGGSHGKTHTGTSANAGSTQSQSKGSTTASGTGTTTGSGSPTNHGKALTLTPPNPSSSKAVAVAYVLSQKGQRAFYVFAKSLPTPPSGTFYAVWLEGAASAADYPLGSLPAKGPSGLVEGGGPLPTNASSYHRIIITSETSHHPSHPGPTVLGGAFTIG